MKTPEPNRPRGRPPIPEDQRRTKTARQRLTPEQFAKLERLGGAQWIRDRIDKAKEPSNG